jgi:peptide/nickel transport system permease protein
VQILRTLLSRLLQALVVLLLVSVATFVVIRAAPGLPEVAADLDIGPEDQARMLASLGLDRPLHEQYLRWLGAVLQGDLGTSLLSGRPVSGMIGQALPASLLLAGSALALAVLVSIPLGIVSAIRRYSPIDYLVTLFSFIGASIPGFWYAILLILLFGVTLGWLPTSGIRPAGREATLIDTVRHLMLPTVVLSTAAMAQLTRYTRSSVLEVLRRDYMRTARAKGLRERVVIVRHGLRNALFPVVTVMGLLIPVLLGGAAVVELVFAWPGIGRLAIDAALRRDYPIVMGVTLLISAVTVASNLVIDFVYLLLDPRLLDEEAVR